MITNHQGRLFIAKLNVTGMATCKEWTKKGSLEEFWNGAHLKDEEREDLEIRGSRRLQQELEREELATWNGLTNKGGE